MRKNFFTRNTCRFCRSTNLENVLPLTPSALCDAYVPSERVNEKQEVYPLALFMCKDCGYVHLPHVVDPETIYRDYIYVTTSSMGLSKHFKGYAAEVMRRLKLPKNSLVVDLGSNDGTLLRFFKEGGMDVLGVEPATAIAEEAKKAGVDTVPDFFNAELAEKIKKDYGAATLITVNNLYANVDDLESFTEGVRRLLAQDGVFVIESSYLGDMMKNMVFDFIYHEHLSYFSIKPLKTFLSRFNMELIDIERVPTKGGSLRYYFQPEGGPRAVSSFVDEMISYEEDLRLGQTQTYKVFSEKINEKKNRLLGHLNDLKKDGKKIAAYGGSATSTTLIYHFGLADKLDYIVDDNPAKHNTFSPGHHLPVLSSDILYEKKPDHVVMLAWRYAQPIIKKHQAFLKQGGNFIVPLPELNIVEKI